MIQLNLKTIFIDLSFHNKLNDEDKRLLNSNKFYFTSLIEDDTLISEINNKRFEKYNKNYSKKNEKLFFILNIMNENFREFSKKNFIKKEKELFYYHISKFYIVLMNNLRNNFTMIFETKKILNQFKYPNELFYLNLRYFYEILCSKSLLYQKAYSLNFHQSFYKLFSSITILIKEEENFLRNPYARNPEKYIEFSNTISKNEYIIKKSYEQLLKETVKNDYQKILFRIIFETLFNKVNSKSKSMFINDDYSMYEEILENQYKNEKVLKLQINLKNKKNTVIKAGRELNIYWNKNFEELLPIEFRKLGMEKFYQNEESVDNKSIIQKFHFIIYNKDHDLKQFIYHYSIYPSLKEDVLYIDGIYKLGKDILIVTKKNLKSNNERICEISNSLEKILFINSALINILKKYNIFLMINEFVNDSKSYTYDLNDFCEYVCDKITSLENICSENDERILQNSKETLQRIRIMKGHCLFQFDYLFSIFEKDNENCLYRIKEVNNNKEVKKKKTIVDWKLNDEDIENQNVNQKLLLGSNNYSNDFDSSFISQKSTNTFASSASINLITNKKKKNEKKEFQQKRKYYIIFFNIFIILMSIFCLIFENYVNQRLKSKYILYMDVFIFNRFILNLMTSYVSLLKICNEELNCHHYFIEYFNEHPKFSDLDEFLYSELLIKMEEITDTYNNLKKRIEQSNEKIINNYFKTEKQEVYITYSNGEFNVNKLAFQKIDYLMKTFINKIIMTTSYNFTTVNIFRFIVDENFSKIKILKGNNIVNFKEIEIYVYDILIFYLDYTNFFYNLQILVEDESKVQLQYNRLTLYFFIISLLISNLFIFTACLTLLRFFKFNVAQRIFKIEEFLLKPKNTEKLIKNMKILNDLVRFYYKPPMELINDLIKNDKTDSKKSESKEEIENNKKETPKYHLYFLLKKFIMIIIICFIFYFIFIMLFHYISNNSFDLLSTTIEIIQKASYTEELTYLVVCLIASANFIQIPDSILYSSFWPIFQNKTITNESSFYADLYNYHQECYLKERRKKTSATSLPDDIDIIVMNCNDFFQQTNISRFYQIIQKNPSKNYLNQLTNYCYHVSSLNFSSQGNFLDNLDYSILKLFMRDTNSKFNLDTLEDDVLVLVTETLIIYRPLRLHLGDFYFNNILLKKVKLHIDILLIFLLVNIVIESILFFIIKELILEKTIEINVGLNRIMRIIKMI